MDAVESGGDWGTKMGRMLWVESLLREPLRRRPAADKALGEYLYLRVQALRVSGGKSGS